MCHVTLLGGAFPEWREVYDRALALMDEVRSGAAEPKAAAAAIRGLFKDLPYVPTYFRWHDPRQRLEDREPCGKADRECGENDVERDRKAELYP